MNTKKTIADWIKQKDAHLKREVAIRKTLDEQKRVEEEYLGKRRSEIYRWILEKEELAVKVKETIPGVKDYQVSGVSCAYVSHLYVSFFKQPIFFFHSW